jgi:hypothetical protein
VETSQIKLELVTLAVIQRKIISKCLEWVAKEIQKTYYQLRIIMIFLYKSLASYEPAKAFSTVLPLGKSDLVRRSLERIPTLRCLLQL